MSKSPRQQNGCRWLELSLEVDAELAEAISEAIFLHVEGGVALEQRHTLGADRWEDEAAAGPVVVRAYLPMDDTLEDRRRKVEEALLYLSMVRPIPQPTYREVDAADWANAWRASFAPLRIGSRILIHPSWIAPAEAGATSEDILVALDPGMAFGTGLHPTTQLCALALLDRVKPAMRVLDVGCGSGILSILAAKLGASDVLAVDTDEEAVRVAQENVAANGVASRVRVAHGSWEQAEGVYDVVVANILAGVIQKMLAEGLGEIGKQFIFSGILADQAELVSNEAQRQGLRLTDRQERGDWIALFFQRAAAD
ncbi:MAG: 50S ribosomal protein L11 methyltransferase [Thermoflexales bacterium]|nr:50S ribosomal protein L11 methyltransferase [Thermoflexales bacterium]